MPFTKLGNVGGVLGENLINWTYLLASVSMKFQLVFNVTKIHT